MTDVYELLLEEAVNIGSSSATPWFINEAWRRWLEDVRAALAQRPEPFAEVEITGSTQPQTEITWLVPLYKHIGKHKLYFEPTSAAALIAEKDAEIERLDARIRELEGGRAAPLNVVAILQQRAEAAERALARAKAQALRAAQQHSEWPKPKQLAWGDYEIGYNDALNACGDALDCMASEHERGGS
jgi:hypothetical protein